MSEGSRGRDPGAAAVAGEPESGRRPAVEAHRRSAAACERDLRAEPNSVAAHRGLALALAREGRMEEALGLWRAELGRPGGAEWASATLIRAMEEPSLAAAGAYAELIGRLRWGALRKPGGEENPEIEGVGQPPAYLSRSKLKHDIEQLEYLRSQAVLGSGDEGLIDAYRGALGRLDTGGPDRRRAPTAQDQEEIGGVYGRLFNVRETPRAERALSDGWDPRAVEREYLDNPPGVVVVDDVLSPDSLEALRAFCLESTVWSGNHYAHGRLGAFFESGFNCPLLLQIAEEFRDALPGVIGERHPLRQLWGFKSGPSLPADSTVHADFAAVNVNLWITPAEANLDPSGGGLVVYELSAPLDWDFDRYNNRLDAIQDYLRRNGAKRRRIPYRENRALIFNSDLFHATDEVRFGPDYEHRRINVTMLYGNREQDQQRPHPAGEGIGPEPEVSPWRSAAFSRLRHSAP